MEDGYEDDGFTVKFFVDWQQKGLENGSCVMMKSIDDIHVMRSCQAPMSLGYHLVEKGNTEPGTVMGEKIT